MNGDHFLQQIKANTVVRFPLVRFYALVSCTFALIYSWLLADSSEANPYETDEYVKNKHISI